MSTSSRLSGAISLVATAAVTGAAAGALGAWVMWSRLRNQFELARDGKKKTSNPTCRSTWLTQKPGNRPRIVLIGTGSVASVKLPALATRIAGIAELAVVLTSSGSHMASHVAERYDAAAMASFQLLCESGNVHVLHDSDEWDGYVDVSADAVVHIELRKWADLLVVAPCSANTLAKVANGFCDNLATCLVRGWNPDKPVIIAPAMNTVMWEHPANAQHLKTLESWGYHILPPASKLLACGDYGRGALPSLDEVMAAVQVALPGYESRRETQGCEAPGAWQRRGFVEWQSAL